MAARTEDEMDTMPEGDLLAVPLSNAAPGDLSRLWARHSAILHQRDVDELALELAGDSGRRFMLFPDQDPKEKRRREEEQRRRAWLAYDESMRDIRERSDRLLAHIKVRQREIEKRRKEIEDNALRLHDGRRVYVDGDRYRDDQGRVLEGDDAREAANAHQYHPDASTWEERRKIREQEEELERLRQKVLKEWQEAEKSGQGLSADEMDRQCAPGNSGESMHSSFYGDWTSANSVSDIRVSAPRLPRQSRIEKCP